MRFICHLFGNVGVFFNRVKFFGWQGAIQGVVGKFMGKKTVAALISRPSFFVRVTGSGSDLAVCHQVFEEHEYSYSCNRTVTTIVDAGANIGCSAVYFAEIFPNARILSIEPSSENFELLRKNTSHLPQVECIHAALWPRTVELGIIDRGLGAWAFQACENFANSAPSPWIERIKGITLNDLLEPRNLATIDILKVDIEGGEREVFADGPNLLKNVNVFIVETHDRWNPGCTRTIYEATREFDYEWHQGENLFFCREGWVPANMDKSRVYKIPSRSIE